MNHSRFPSLLHGYHNQFYTRMIVQQTIPRLVATESVRGGKFLRLLRGPNWPYSLTQILQVFTRHIVWEQLSRVFLLTGLVNKKQSSPSTEATESLSNQWKLFQIRCDIDQLVEERESLLTQFAAEDDPNTHSQLQAQLDQVSSDIQRLAEQKDTIKRAIRKSRAKANSSSFPGGVDPELPESLLSDPVAEWLISLLSTIISDVLTFPLQTSLVWHAAQPQASSWSDNVSSLYEAIRNNQKGAFEGLGIHIAYLGLHSLVIIPAMKLTKWALKIPAESQLRVYLSELVAVSIQNGLGFSAGFTFSEDLEFGSNLERKKEIKTAFRAVMKNSVAYSVADWGTRCSLFPLLRVFHQLAAQGCSFLTPHRGWNVISAVHQIYRKDGFSGFYHGFRPHLFTIVPELLLWGFSYVAISIWIEYRMKEFEDDEEYLSS